MFFPFTTVSYNDGKLILRKSNVPNNILIIISFNPTKKLGQSTTTCNLKLQPLIEYACLVYLKYQQAS